VDQSVRYIILTHFTAKKIKTGWIRSLPKLLGRWWSQAGLKPRTWNVKLYYKIKESKTIIQNMNGLKGI